MANLRDELKALLREQPFIEEALHEDLINISSLARRIKPDLENRMGKELNEGAVVMAIRRIGPGLQLQLQKRFRKFITQLGDIIVRSNLVDMTFQNSLITVKSEFKFLQLIENMSPGFYSFSRGVDETTIIVSSHYEKSLAEAFEGEKMITHLQNLSSVTLKMPASNTDTLGLYYYFFKNFQYSF